MKEAIEILRRLGRLAVSAMVALGLADPQASADLASSGGAVLAGIVGAVELWRFAVDTWPKLRAKLPSGG